MTYTTARRREMEREAEREAAHYESGAGSWLKPIVDREDEEQAQHKRTIRAGDFYRFRYNESERKRLGFSANHCFEGTLYAVVKGDEIMLVDTYWGIGSTGGRAFTQHRAEQQGTLTFYFNINDTEPIKEHETVYYADADVFAVSEQHACVPRCVHYFKRKGAERNQEKMLTVIDGRIKDRQREIDSAKSSLIQLNELRRAVESGDLTVYL